MFLKPGWPGRVGVLVACLVCGGTQAGEANIAVASNFREPAMALARAYEPASGHRLHMSFGSTGTLYAQIINGAPYDAFLAADAQRPAKLVAQELGIAGSRFTYALGSLVLWSPAPGTLGDGSAVLRTGDFRRLAIANPRLAPYGRAARQVLQRLELWRPLQDRLVRGQNVAQAWQFVASGNAEFGMVAWSQLRHPGRPVSGNHWRVPQELYDAIEQQAVQLSQSPAAADFLRFCRSPAGRAIIRGYGYDVATD